MASKKKESEGIVLLSMDNDEEEEEEEDDYEMDDAPADNGGRERVGDLECGELETVDGDWMGVEVRRETERTESVRVVGEEDGGGGGGMGGVDESGDGDLSGDGVFVEKVVVMVESREELGERSGGRRTVEKMAIVDYAHDDIAVSPENEELTFPGENYTVVHKESQSAKGDLQEIFSGDTVRALSPHNQDISFSSEHMNSLPHEAGNLILTESNVTEGDDPARTSGAIDPLNKFLPPPPATLCSQELQDKVIKFLKYKKAGKSFNAEVRNRKDYRNPNFLLHAVRYQGIDQVGSCFSKDVFDPRGYDPCDYYDEIEGDMKREQERKQQERKKSQQIEFVSAGALSAAAAAMHKVNMSVTGNLAAGDGLNSADTASHDVRLKKSKWDKVDDERKTPLPPSGKDSLSSAASNAGSGYTSFAQQRRREAEERISADRKPEKRS